MNARTWCTVGCALLLAGRPVLGQAQEVLVFEDAKAGRFELPDRLPCVYWDANNWPWSLVRHVGGLGTELVLLRQREEVARMGSSHRGALTATPRADALDVVWEIEALGRRQVCHRAFGLSAKKWLHETQLVAEGPDIRLAGVAVAGDKAIVVMTQHAGQRLLLHVREAAAAWRSPIVVVDRTVVAQCAVAASQERIVAAYTTADGLCFVRPYSLVRQQFEDDVGVPAGTDRAFRCSAEDAIELATWGDLVYLTMVDRGHSAQPRLCCCYLAEPARWVDHALPGEWQPDRLRLRMESAGRARLVGVDGANSPLSALAAPGGVTIDKPPFQRPIESLGVGSAADGAACFLVTSMPASRAGRRGHVVRYGGSKAKEAAGRLRANEAAVAAALDWLARHQDRRDGRWDCDQFMKCDDPASPVCSGPGNAAHDVGVTGLALLCFLNDGGSPDTGLHSSIVDRAAAWLVAQQRENGVIGVDASHDHIYDHAIATQALVRAFGVSKADWLAAPAQRAVDYLEQHRNPYSVWRYQPRDNDNDTSVTGWCGAALVWTKSFGMQVNPEALKLTEVWLDQISDATGLHGYDKQGEASYRKPGDHRSRFPPEKGAAMTAVGLWSRILLGQDAKDKPVMKAAADLILAKPPVWNEKDGSIDFYYWYFATRALRAFGGSHWNDWQRKVEFAVLRNQHRDKARPNLYGSWDPVDAWGGDGGRVYSTAMLCMALQWDAPAPRR